MARRFVFQSTLPRGERRHKDQQDSEIYTISIHAPTGGATVQKHLIPSYQNISTHAPTRGATYSIRTDQIKHLLFQPTLPRGERRKRKILQPLHRNFNPRSHEGSDFQRVRFSSLVRISTHAPTRGATPIFISTTKRKKFQPTLPRGERQYSAWWRRSWENFNPRSHEGSDRAKINF